MRRRRSRLIWAPAATILLLPAYLGISHFWPRIDDRVYAIGWQDDPPFQYKAEDGSPAGLAVNLIREAARRRGIRLRWIWHPGSSEGALRNRDLDLWPLITITPERIRQKAIYISKPYLQHDYSLVVSASSGYSQVRDLASAAIATLGLPLGRQFFAGILPHARLIPMPSEKQVVESVCAGKTDAAFLNELTASAISLAGISCPQPLRVIPLPMLRSRLGVGSTLEATVVADEIRRGIDASEVDGDLAKVLNSEGYFSHTNLEYFTALLKAQQQEQRLIVTLGVFALLLALTILAADRIRRQRNQIAAAEQALRQSERKLRVMANNLTEMVLAYDMDRRLVFANPAVEQLIGYSADELKDQPFAFWVHPDDCSRMVACWEKLFRGDPFRDEEYKLTTKNGSVKWSIATWVPIHDDAGRQVGVQSSERDITELRTLRSEAARLESEERFRHMADTAPLMIWVTGSDKGCTFVNKGWLAFTGRGLDQELGDGWTTNVHPDDLEYCRGTYTAAFDARRAFQAEHRLRRADGEYRWVLGGGVPRFSPEGEFAGYIGNATDITDLKRSRDEDVARQKLESVGRLAEGIAHDFNNLLGGVLAQAELAVAELAAGATLDEQLKNIREVAIRGASIVRQLLIYAGQEGAVSEPIDISCLIDEMLDLLRVVVSKHAALQTDLVHDLPAVQANPAQLRQVVMNLVTNASEAIGERDGSIVIRTARDAAIGGVAIEISDSGCGIKPEDRAKIFDPFFTTKSGGHGLGLAVVQRIVQGLGGAIAIESESGRGTTFHIVLPPTGEVPARSRPAPALETVEAGDQRASVLIVEDEAVLRLAVAKLLRKAGFPVVEAADGTAAITAIREHKDTICVVLLDITLPGIPSREVLAEIRRVRPKTKVIVTSAYGADRVEQSFPGMEIDFFVRKPYQFADLISQVRQFSREHKKYDSGRT